MTVPRCQVRAIQPIYRCAINPYDGSAHVESMVPQGRSMMQSDDRQQSRLGYLELAAIDLTITALEAAGHTIDDISKDDNPREQWAQGWADAHHPVIELSERDREIIQQIKALAGQLSSRTSLPELLSARGKIIQGR